MKLNGTIKIEKLNIIFAFFFDGQTISLSKIGYINENIQTGVRYFNGAPIDFDILNGKNSLGGDIYFINSRIMKISILSDEYIGQCQYILIPECENTFYNEFTSLTFKGKLIDKFYSSINCINIRYDLDTYYFQVEEDGSKTIKFKNSREYTINKQVNISGNNIRLSLSVDLSFSGNDSNKFLGLNSRLSLYFESPQEIYDITKWYRTIIQTFQFLSNRQEVEFETAVIGNKENAKLANLYLSNKDKSLKIDDEIYKFVEHHHIIDNIDKLFNIMYDKKINMYHLPANDTEHNFLTPEKLVFTASSFEYEFDLLNKDNAYFDNSELLYVQNELNKSLDKIDNEFKEKNKRIRKICSSLKDIINKYNTSLENKIYKVLEENKNLFEYIIKKNRY